MPVIDKTGQIIDAATDILVIGNIADAETEFNLHHNSPILGIEFPVYSDGRGFTLAKRLRLLGFKGKLRAVGNVIPDQFLELLEVGFDEIDISDERLARQPIENWQNALKAYSAIYQNNGQKQSILAARWSKT